MKTTKKNRLLNKIIFLAIILAVIFLILLAIWLEIPLFLEELFKKPQMFQIKDECSMILSKLIHQINDQNACKIKCISECSFRETEFYNSSFIPNEDSCSICNCYCK
jgi:hypothetical protein